jgi:hypothetical protein
MKIQMTVRYPLTSISISSIKWKTNKIAENNKFYNKEGPGGNGTLYIACGNVKWYTRNLCGGSSKNCMVAPQKKKQKQNSTA